MQAEEGQLETGRGLAVKERKQEREIRCDDDQNILYKCTKDVIIKFVVYIINIC